MPHSTINTGNKEREIGEEIAYIYGHDQNILWDKTCCCRYCVGGRNWCRKQSFFLLSLAKIFDEGKSHQTIKLKKLRHEEK